MFTKGCAPQPFLGRAAAAAPVPTLLAVGSHCARYLCSQLLPDRAIGPPAPERWALVFESSPVPAPTLSSVTSAKRMQGRWIPLVFPVSWHLLVPPSTYLPVGAGHEELCYHTASADRVLRGSRVVLSPPSVNSWCGLCVPASWRTWEPTYLGNIVVIQKGTLSSPVRNMSWRQLVSTCLTQWGIAALKG